MPVSQEILDEIALSQAEYDMIVDRLDREPNPVELGMFGALWSEHCGYKHSGPLLGLLPSRSDRTLSQAGAENAGAIDIGNGLAVVFKVESHNHPSAVEPLQGAATGVGGIVRDILAMGARPIALLNSLRFGPPDSAANRRLLKGVVDGIGWYGNCIGVPDVAGEIYFDDCYSQNPLVNAMCVGIARIEDLASAAADRTGDILLLAGAGHRPRRDSRRVRISVAHIRRGARTPADGAGGQPLPGEIAHRSLPGSPGYKQGQGAAGSGGGRPDQRGGGIGGARR